MKSRQKFWKRVKHEIEEIFLLAVCPALVLVGMFAWWLAFGY